MAGWATGIWGTGYWITETRMVEMLGTWTCISISLRALDIYSHSNSGKTTKQQLQTATSRYSHIWRWWTLHQQDSNGWPTWCSSPANGTVGYKVGPTATETYQLHTERPLNQWPWAQRVLPAISGAWLLPSSNITRGTTTYSKHRTDTKHRDPSTCGWHCTWSAPRISYMEAPPLVPTALQNGRHKSQELPRLSSHHMLPLETH